MTVKLSELRAAVERASHFGREGSYSPEWLTMKRIAAEASVLLEIAETALAYRTAREAWEREGGSAGAVVATWEHKNTAHTALLAALAKVSP